MSGSVDVRITADNAMEIHATQISTGHVYCSQLSGFD